MACGISTIKHLTKNLIMKKIILSAFALGTLQLAHAQTKKETVTFTPPVIKKNKEARNIEAPPPPPPKKLSAPTPPAPKAVRSRKAKKANFKAPIIVKEEATR
jgi:hypothetical protein